MLERKTRWRLAGLLVAPLLAMLFTACAASASDGEAPDPDETQVSDAGQWALDYAACMREHGIDMEDPDPSGDVIEGVRPEEDTPQRQEATAACLEKLGPAPGGQGGGEESMEEIREELLAMAKCLRDLGYDVDDPRPGEGLGMPAGLTDEAMDQCAEFVPSEAPAP